MDTYGYRLAPLGPLLFLGMIFFIGPTKNKMKKIRTGIFLFLLIAAAGCADPSSTAEETTNDTMPIVKPGVLDTTSVITPPPTGDSNVVRPEN